MWKIRRIMEADYGCEERAPGEKLKCLVELVDEKGNTARLEVQDEWLRRNGLDEGSSWKDYLPDMYEYRDIHPDELEQAIAIEQICFPPNEACSPKAMTERIAAAPELFMAVICKETGKLAGFFNGISTNEDIFRDEFFTDIKLYDPNGRNVMMLGLDVLPEHRGKGLGRETAYQYSVRERAKGRDKLYLTCLAGKVEMYKKFGYTDKGIANSSWGGEEWHEMVIDLR